MAEDKVDKPQILYIAGPRTRSKSKAKKEEFSQLHKKFLSEHSRLEKFCKIYGGVSAKTFIQGSP